jgi:hypothetical protein
MCSSLTGPMYYAPESSQKSRAEGRAYNPGWRVHSVNRLKALPWTQILLFLLLVATVANYFKLRDLEDSVDSVSSQLDSVKSQLNQILLR